MPELPTGTVTFLFTDIEGSTQRWEHQPDLMRRAFARHETILRAAMAAHAGYVYKMIGDAFQVAFATAPAALAAALEAQRGLQADAGGEGGPLRVRMALHTGVTDERGAVARSGRCDCRFYRPSRLCLGYQSHRI